MGIDVPVLQVVGFQNSGKTTLVEQIVRACAQKGFRVGTLKHHGHGGRLDPVDQHKDTGKHRLAGAVMSGVQGGDTFQITLEDKSFSGPEVLLPFYSSAGLDLVIIEGFKRYNYPKVVLLRDRADLNLIEQSSEIIAVISREKDITVNSAVPFFTSDQSGEYTKKILCWIERRVQ
ncbi:molybdopterin-guanine dinucleotide biosynthesis protein B [Pseudalkalibacillus caeni]|uniref:Molybdopterin-guanine dinucleotide biosynthesis protein B n=1 Tax=Exobacillus caeni TaxID=2574798 RepID=A0A5R9F4A1_9BACL|nr:molybdopterin-guanine dinucleotide biosynthesis protein B [Pseudalkalibacillus caeni]TLS37841.1 molybdopterin-guanine dinucleotide biosynthesis protein B [Pseudalkalibacillus caeni]